MSLSLAVILGGLVCLGLKATGYLLPDHWLGDPRTARAAQMITAGLLAALLAVQTFAQGGQLALDARVAAVAAAAVALWLRAPFLLVVLIGAGAAAAVRALGWG